MQVVQPEGQSISISSKYVKKRTQSLESRFTSSPVLVSSKNAISCTIIELKSCFLNLVTSLSPARVKKNTRNNAIDIRMKENRNTKYGGE